MNIDRPTPMPPYQPAPEPCKTPIDPGFNPVLLPEPECGGTGRPVPKPVLPSGPTWPTLPGLPLPGPCAPTCDGVDPVIQRF